MGFFHALGRQLRKPRGVFGIAAGALMNRTNGRLNEWTINLLDIRPADRVLELGFGPGAGIRRAATLAHRGFVAGIDFSETMVAMAQRRNAAAIAEGRVELREGDVTSLPYPDDSFDKVFAVQLIYFCSPPEVFLGETRRILRPDGRVAISFTSMEDAGKWPFAKPDVFALYTAADAERLMKSAGLTNIRVQTQLFRRQGLGICAIGAAPAH